MAVPRLRQTELTTDEKLVAHGFYHDDHLSILQIADAFRIAFKAMRTMIKKGGWKRGPGYLKYVNAKRQSSLRAIESQKNAIKQKENKIILTQPELFEVEYQPYEPWPSDQRFDAPGMNVVETAIKPVPISTC